MVPPRGYTPTGGSPKTQPKQIKLIKLG